MAAKVRFQIVLNVHRAEEDAAKRSLGQLESARVDLLQAIRTRERNLTDAAASTVDVRQREQLARFWPVAQARVQAALKALADHDTQIAAARTRLIAAHRQVATFEQLQTRDRQAARALSDRREARAMDEFAQRPRLMSTHDRNTP